MSFILNVTNYHYLSPTVKFWSRHETFRGQNSGVRTMEKGRSVNLCMTWDLAHAESRNSRGGNSLFVTVRPIYDLVQPNFLGLHKDTKLSQHKGTKLALAVG